MMLRGSTKVIQTPEERKAAAREQRETVARAIAIAEARLKLLLLNKTVVDILYPYPDGSRTETIVLAFSDGSRVRFEPSEWLDVTEEN